MSNSRLDEGRADVLRLSKSVEFVFEVDTSTKTGMIAAMMPDHVLQDFAQGLLDRVIADLNENGSYAFFYYNELGD